jgi:hypothetical protein
VTGARDKALTGPPFSAIVNLRHRKNLLDLQQNLAFLSKNE